MNMNTLPQHDLSFDETKVSFPLLEEVTRIAVGYAKMEAERQLCTLQQASLRNDWREMSYAAASLASASNALNTAANTLLVLTESKSRSVFTVIGKPVVTEK